MKNLVLAFFILVIVGTNSFLNAQTALRMDGVNDYVATSSNVVMANTWTYETWVKPNDPSPGWSGIITSNSGSGSGMWFQFCLSSTGRLRWESSGPGLSLDEIGPVINNNLWHHVAVTCDEINIRFYTDGVLQNTTAFSGGTMARPIHIMAERVPTQWIPGDVDKTMIWNYARSLAEINSDMNNCLTGAETGLLIYYQYEDGIGSTTVTDKAILGGNNIGNLMNMNSATAWVSNITDNCLSSITKFGENSFIPANSVGRAGAIGGSGLTANGKVVNFAPTLAATSAASLITGTTASSGGTVSSDGGAVITARGVCWSTSTGPTTASSKTTDAGTTGSFTSSLTGLTGGTTYYVRAYATNSIGTAYGSEISFTTAMSIGSSYQGGIVAYIFQSGDPGYVAGQTHGLIMSTANLGLCDWGCLNTVTGATATLLGTGNANTTTIIGVCTTAGIAAKLCDVYSASGYTDWYLPSINELRLLYSYHQVYGGFTAAPYWSSSEESGYNAYDLNFTNGSWQGHAKVDIQRNVRAVRTF